MIRAARSALGCAAFAALLLGCPDVSEEHVRKGNVLFSNGDLTGAEAQYARAIEISPRNAIALEGIGNVFFEKGDLENAEGWYRKAILADRRALNPRHRLAITLSERGDPRSALGVLEEALAIDARDVFALHAIGGVYHRLGDLGRAESMQVAALKVDPDHRAARFALVNVLVDAGRFEEAERENIRLRGLGARNLSEYGFARLAAKQARFDASARHLEALLELGVTHPAKILQDAALNDAWSHPAMQRVRERLESMVADAARDPR